MTMTPAASRADYPSGEKSARAASHHPSSQAIHAIHLALAQPAYRARDQERHERQAVPQRRRERCEPPVAQRKGLVRALQLHGGKCHRVAAEVPQQGAPQSEGTRAAQGQRGRSVATGRGGRAVRLGGACAVQVRAAAREQAKRREDGLGNPVGDLSMDEGEAVGPVGGGVHDGRVDSEAGLRCGGGLAAEEQEPKGVRGLEVTAQLLLAVVEDPRGRRVRRREA